MTTTLVNPAVKEEIKELEKRELEQLEKQDRFNKVTKFKSGDAITERQKLRCSRHKQVQDQMNTYLDLNYNSEDRFFQETQKKYDLEVELNRFKNKTEDLSKERDNNQSLLQTLFKEIENLFLQSECNKLPIQQLLGDNKQVNEFNFMLYSKLIDARITDVLTTSDLPEFDTNLNILSKPPEDSFIKFKDNSNICISTALFASDPCSL